MRVTPPLTKINLQVWRCLYYTVAQDKQAPKFCHYNSIEHYWLTFKILSQIYSAANLHFTWSLNLMIPSQPKRVATLPCEIRSPSEWVTFQYILKLTFLTFFSFSITVIIFTTHLANESKWRWYSSAKRINAGRAESNGSLLPVGWKTTSTGRVRQRLVFTCMGRLLLQAAYVVIWGASIIGW